MSHTPGPWVVEREKLIVARTGDYFDGQTVALIYRPKHDASLIAATLDLLEALKRINDAFTKYGSNREFCEWFRTTEVGNVRAAIAKAEGR